MGWWPWCCCIGCPDRCAEMGYKFPFNSSGACSNVETPVFFMPVEQPGTDYVGNIVIVGGDPLFFPIPPTLDLQEVCRWQETMPGALPDDPETTTTKWTLEILGDDEAEIYVEYDGDLYVYKISNTFDPPHCDVFERDFDPLCTNIFELDVSESEFPAVLLPRCLCVSWANICCDNSNFLTQPSLPRKLFGTLEFCCGDQGPLFEEIEFDWDPVYGGWKGEIETCFGVFAAQFRCDCGIADGCTTDPENPMEESACYRGVFSHTACGFQNYEIFGLSCSCDPFELTFAIGVPDDCCDVEVVSSWNLTIME